MLILHPVERHVIEESHTYSSWVRDLVRNAVSREATARAYVQEGRVVGQQACQEYTQGFHLWKRPQNDDGRDMNATCYYCGEHET